VRAMNRITKSTKRKGFTLVEVIIGLTVVALFLGAIGTVTMSARGVYEQGLSSASIEARARRTVQRLASELVAAGAASVTPQPIAPLGASTITYRACVGYAAGAQLWTTLSRIELRADPRDANDGTDNDGDGSIDEQQIVLVRDVGMATETEAVICGGVRELLEGENANLADDNANGLSDERGLSFIMDGNDTITIRLTLEARDPREQLVMQTVQTSVHLRN
jgi:prepilin-type N-terminal cleavage/methylation domain-containing protein